MRCIFCKSDSSSSKSVEHILPEALGNTEHVLPQGIVCDVCNNYFAIKIEKPVLESNHFLQARYRNMIPNKKGHIPSIKGIHFESAIELELSHQQGNIISPVKESEFPRFWQKISKEQWGRIILPVPLKPDSILFSRFLGKVAIEALALRMLSANNIDEVVDHPELDNLRNYVRYGSNKLKWPFHMREIYDEVTLFQEGDASFQVLHEYVFLYPNYPDSAELYFVIAIFGTEYALNLDFPEIQSYLEWLHKNENKSPLYE